VPAAEASPAEIATVKWTRKDWGRVPVISWCEQPDPKAAEQAANLARHPAVERHVALMPDCHVGFGMPIGAVIFCPRDILPNAVGVDIGCGMRAVRTSIPVERMTSPLVRAILDDLKRAVPIGEGRSHRGPQKWEGFEEYDAAPPWKTRDAWDLALRSLGTLGGGNHFLELQAGEDGRVWFMIHSGSRNLGLRIAHHYQEVARRLCERRRVGLPDRDLAHLPVDSEEGRQYLRDMEFALRFARENRRRMSERFREAVARHVPEADFEPDLDVHHNYAVLERHFGEAGWVHRKGATAAAAGALGIVPGSMGSPSYIVRGLGHPDSFSSSAHGAGRRMGRMEACRSLSREECDAAMRGIVFDGWRRLPGAGRRRDRPGEYDLEEAPQAYKPIEGVMEAQRDLVEPVVRLRPLGVVKG